MNKAKINKNANAFKKLRKSVIIVLKNWIDVLIKEIKIKEINFPSYKYL